MIDRYDSDGGDYDVDNNDVSDQYIYEDGVLNEEEVENGFILHDR